MSVELEPAELGFRRPFTTEVSRVLRLHNPNSEPVAFKVKTTAPKQYCVRPNSGRIEAGHNVEVHVLLQAMKEDPPPDAKCRDKFLVQSVQLSPETATANVAQVWQSIEQTAKASIQERKLRVFFLPPAGDAGAAGGPIGAAAFNGEGPHHDDESPAYSSPTPNAVTPQRSMASVPASTPADKPAYAESRVDAVGSLGNPATNSSSLAGMTTQAGLALSNATAISPQDLQRQLDAANAKIKQLTDQASEGMRQRKITSEGKETTTSGRAMQMVQAPGGVPIQYVAALCLLCFLIAYFFF